MNRLLMPNTYEAAPCTNGDMAYPLATCTQKEVLSYMKQKRLPMPVRYGKNASNGIGFNEDWRLETVVLIHLLRRCKNEGWDVYSFSDRSG